jgi:hypothetical protein
MTLRGKSLFVSGIHVGCIFQQKAAHVCMTRCSRRHQGSALTEKNKSINKQSFASVHKMTLRGKSHAVSGIHVGCIFQQKAANVCMTLGSRPHQGGHLTEKQIN